MLTFIPFVLAGGIIAGYVIGDFLEKKFSLGPPATYISVGLAIAASILEVIRIIRLVLKINNKP